MIYLNSGHHSDKIENNFSNQNHHNLIKNKNSLNSNNCSIEENRSFSSEIVAKRKEENRTSNTSAMLLLHQPQVRKFSFRLSIYFIIIIIIKITFKLLCN